jgi:tetratricopeptide (TPR) repeat protein
VGWKTATLTAVLGVVALTIWAAVTPDVLKSPWGLLSAAVLTAMASIAAGCVPLIRDAVQRRRTELAQLETEEAADQEALRRASEQPAIGPAGLLDPRRGLVGFTGREHELGGLLAWCEDGRARGVRLVTGPGGVGKTRLSVELCARLDPDRWRCVRVGDGEEALALVTARRGWPGPVLLVLDYAETRIGLGGLLRAVAADAGPVRVLLLARSAGEWRDRLAAAEPAVRELLTGGDEPLAAAVSGELSNADLVRAAVPVFAKALGVAAPSRVLAEAIPGAVRVLDLHAAALVAVLRSPGARAPVRVSVADVLDELLGHEERFWQGTAARLDLLGGPSGMSVAMLRQIVAAAALLGARSREQAVELLERVPGAATSVPVACWLRDLYPPEGEAADGGGAEWLGSLRPDRLAERLVVAQLTGSAELAERCLSGLDEQQALRAVTLLGRAAADQQEAAGVLLERVLPLLERVVAGLPDDVGLLTAISDAIPYPSAALAQADLAVTRRILQILPDGDPGLRARWLSWLGTALAQIGRPAEALPAEQEALEAYRELAAADPDRYRPDLAASLSNLGVLYAQLGRPAEALPPAQESVEIRRELAAADPDQYQAALALSLSNLGVRFSELGRLTEALPPAQEAAEIRRELAAADPDQYQAALALSLSNLGVRFWELGRLTEALPPAQEAAEAYRELAAADPDRYQAALALSLSNLGIRFWELGRLTEALPPAQEAAEIRRELAAADPDRYRAALADSLSNLGIWFWELGRLTEALPPTQEAVEIRRELAAAHPDQYQAALALALSNLGILLSQLGRLTEALPPAQEAAEIRRELAAADPDRHRAALALTLSNLGVRFSQLGRPAEALPPTQEAAEAYRELAAADPDRYRAALAISLSNLGLRFSQLGRPAEALPPAQEAVEIRRELAAAHPDRYRAALADSLSNLAVRFWELGRAAEALPPAQEAAEAYRELIAASTDQYRPALARSIRVLALALDSLGRAAEAEAARRDADLDQ